MHKISCLGLLLAVAFFSSSLKAQTPSASEDYRDVPSGLLLSPAQRQENTNITPEPPEAGIDPQIQTHSLNLITQNTDSAATILGMREIEAAYAQKKYTSIIKPLEYHVNQNDMQAAVLLGLLYESGQGVAADAQRATALFARAADAGIPAAQHRLALNYYFGRGVSKDSLRALMWLQIAALSYKDGTQKHRVISDRDNLSAALTRREQDAALLMAREWLTKKGKAHILDAQQPLPVPDKTLP